VNVRAGDKPPHAPVDPELLNRWLNRQILPPAEAEEMLSGFVEQQLQALPLPATLEEWEQRREILRKKILTVVGLDDWIPAPWDLNLVHHGVLQRDGYRVEPITYESYPGFANAALLYVPDGTTGLVPGLVSISGHTADSKAAAYIQQRNVNLVKRGCVVVAYDYFGYGDRKTGDQPGYPEGANGHENSSFSYSRRTATALEILDGIRALDVLSAQPQVDPERIGFTGESGGSNSTYWISALDPRVKLAVPVSSVTTFDYWIRGDINWDWHQRPPGIRRFADIGTLLALHAPHPLVIISSRRGTDDAEFPLHEAEKSYQWAKHVYDLYGAGDRAIHYESSTAHGYQQDKREELYAAVERWLAPPFPHDGKELDAAIEKLEDISTALPASNQTFQSIMTGWVSALPHGGEEDAETRRSFLRERLGWPAELPRTKRIVTARETNGPWTAEFWIVQTEEGIRLPAVAIFRQGNNPSATLLPGRENGAAAAALERGGAVVVFDPRGLGETSSGKGGNWAWNAGEPWLTLLGDSGAIWTNWSWFAGRPVPGQWAFDIVQVAHATCEALHLQSVAVEANNDLGWTAMLAGASAPDVIPSGIARLRHSSMHDEIRARGDRALADVPGLLEHLDVPQIRALWPGECHH